MGELLRHANDQSMVPFDEVLTMGTFICHSQSLNVHSPEHDPNTSSTLLYMPPFAHHSNHPPHHHRIRVVARSQNLWLHL